MKDILIGISNDWMGQAKDFRIFELSIHNCGNCQGFEIVIMGLGIGIAI